MKIFKGYAVSVMLILFSCVFFCPRIDAQASPADNGVLFRVLQQDKWGYIDKTGKIIVPPQYDAAGLFSEGMAGVMKGKKWGYVDAAGNLTIKPQFTEISPFSEGLAAVRIGDRWGYVDRTGKMAIKAQFNCPAAPFTDGLAAVGHIDIKKKISSVWYIDKTGKKAFDSSYPAIRSFSEGLAAVGVIGGTVDEKTVRMGFIDTTGKIAIPAQWIPADISSFHEGLAIISVEGKWGVIDKTGKTVIEPRFDAALFFTEGLAAVKLGNQEEGKWGFIDHAGTMAILPQFDDAGGFSEGMAPIKIDGKWGYADKTGKIAITPKYDVCGDFTGGRAAVVIDNKLGYIDQTGQYIWEPRR